MEVTTAVEVLPTKTQSVNVLLLFAPTIFLSALLLFCLEPMVGKMMLPFLGGASSVWITCLLFFQLMLLAGYAYAYLLNRYVKVRSQMLVQAAVMLAAIVFMPIHFGSQPGAWASTHPALWLLGILLRSVGVPFCIVSTTAPLLQNWLSKTSLASGRDPYFLYAISNAGSLAALIAYPLLIEPRWGVRIQSSGWFVGYFALLVMVTGGACLLWKHVTQPGIAAHREEATPISPRQKAYWLAGAFVPSGLMLAVTNHILLNLASVPFLWVIPLALYLTTFMIAFARKLRISSRILSTVVPIILLVLFPLVAVSKPVTSDSIWYLLGSHMLVLFAGALLCHTAVASRRPEPAHLTEFYFWIALGGVLGGMFVAIIAPFVFSTVIEYPLLVAMIAFFRETPETGNKLEWGDLVYPTVVGVLIAVTWALFRWATVDVMDNFKTSIAADAVLVLIAYLARKRRVRFALALAVLIGGYHLALPGFLDDYEILHVDRNFFGIKKVVFDLDSNMRKLLHGDTLHGLESMDATLSGQPLSYYHSTGPIGDVMTLISDRPHQHVAVVGLGTGSMAGWARPDRHITFFDIDPQVYDIAHNFFTYLRRCERNCNVVIGDGRLSIGKEADGEFDVILLDAFSSDSIPAHLVSREAVQMYIRKLKPDGLLLFHVSNRYMDVESLAAAVLTDAGLQGMVRYDDDEEPTGKTSSDYVAAARYTEDFGKLAEDENWSKVEKPESIQPWTDDYSNMLSIIRWK